MPRPRWKSVDDLLASPRAIAQRLRLEKARLDAANFCNNTQRVIRKRNTEPKLDFTMSLTSSGMNLLTSSCANSPRKRSLVQPKHLG